MNGFIISMIYHTHFTDGIVYNTMLFSKIPLAEKDFKKKQEMRKMRYPIKTSEFKEYVLRADQQIAGEIYFYYFHEIVKNQKLILSRRLKSIFFVFDSSIEKMISKIIYSKFLFVDIPEKLLKKNIYYESNKFMFMEHNI
ncbi:hypothetical protein DMUE_2409 [Dictyocoela muelleri]|nr:hypothetical protein DMUE_2409 [Dictyocoela muelleri]